jgi:murein DD-endopeptidase MepM/ murein hydrolase activator NlpD
VGKKYLITRELRPGYIDCSTIISQAHWEGAAVQAPFIAESQRLAPSGRYVAGPGEMLPGDSIFEYPAKHMAPGGRHNHVAMFLCSDPWGEAWAIEARESSGAEIVNFRRIRSDGGIKRFCPHPNTSFEYGAWQALAAAVPKLARLGARLTARYTDRVRHAGTDIYTNPESAVLAPIDGVVTDLKMRDGLPISAEIYSDARKISTLLAPIVTGHGISVGQEVVAGDVIGRLDNSRKWIGCNAIPVKRGLCSLHWELWSGTNLGYPPAQGIDPAHSVAWPTGQATPYNPVYAVKVGVVAAPLPDPLPRPNSNWSSACG